MGADALQGIGQQWPSDRANNNRSSLGGLRSLVAVGGRKSTPFHGADGADALQGIGRQWASVRGNNNRSSLGGLRSLVAVGGPKSTPFLGADGAGRPPGNRPAMAIRSRQ